MSDVMKKRSVGQFIKILTFSALLLPGVSRAAFLLDTGTPGSTSFPELLNGQWYAAEFAAAKGQTLSQFSAYLAPNISNVGNDTFNFDLYSANGFLSTRANPAPTILYSVNNVAFSGTTGWSRAIASYTIQNTGNYWLAIEETGGSTIDVPEETSNGTGTAPALGFAYRTSGGWTATTTEPIGLEVAVPEPAAYGAFGGAGVLLLSCWNQLRRKQA